MNKIYRLTSCALHIGTDLYNGHYILHKFDINGDFSCEMNDSIIDYKNIRDIEKDGYIFIYRLIKIDFTITNDIKFFENEHLPKNFEDIINLNVETPNKFRLEEFEYEINKSRCKSKNREKYLLNSKNDLYYNKYIKYKNKYFELKNNILFLSKIII